MTLPTPTELRNFLIDYGIDATVASDTWITSRLNNTVVPFIENAIGRPLESVETVEGYYSGNGMSTLLLRHKQLASFVSVDFVDRIDITPGVGLTSLECDLEAGILKRINGIFPKGERNLKITYTLGSTSIPDDLKECCLYLLGELVLTFISNQTGGGSPTTEGFSRNFGDRGRWSSIRQDFTRHAISILKRYMSGLA